MKDNVFSIFALARKKEVKIVPPVPEVEEESRLIARIVLCILLIIMVIVIVVPAPKREAVGEVRTSTKKRRKRRKVACWLSTKVLSSVTKERTKLAELNIELTVVRELSQIPSDTQVLITNEACAFACEAKFLSSLKKLEAVIVPNAGIPSQTLKALTNEKKKRQGQLITCNSHHNASATAEMAITLTLAAAKRITTADDQLRTGDWRGRGLPLPDGPVPPPVLEQLILDGRTALILGLGAVGSKVANVLSAMGMSVLATTRSSNQNGRNNNRDNYKHVAPAVKIFSSTELMDLLPRAQIVIVCLPLGPDTTGLLNRKALAKLPSSAVLINVARGPVVDEAAVHEALTTDSISCYASDVWWNYPKTWQQAVNCPPAKNHNFATLPKHKLLFSPHRAGAVGTRDNDRRLIAAIVSSLSNYAYAYGDPQALAHGDITFLNLDAGY